MIKSHPHAPAITTKARAKSKKVTRGAKARLFSRTKQILSTTAAEDVERVAADLKKLENPPAPKERRKMVRWTEEHVEFLAHEIRSRFSRSCWNGKRLLSAVRSLFEIDVVKEKVPFRNLTTVAELKRVQDRIVEIDTMPDSQDGAGEVEITIEKTLVEKIEEEWPNLSIEDKFKVLDLFKGFAADIIIEAKLEQETALHSAITARRLEQPTVNVQVAVHQPKKHKEDKEHIRILTNRKKHPQLVSHLVSEFGTVVEFDHLFHGDEVPAAIHFPKQVNQIWIDTTSISGRSVTAVSRAAAAACIKVIEFKNSGMIKSNATHIYKPQVEALSQ